MGIDDIDRFIASTLSGVADGRLRSRHVLAYQIGVPVMLAALAGLLLDNPQCGPIVGVASVAVVTAIILFAISLWRVLGQAGLEN